MQHRHRTLKRLLGATLGLGLVIGIAAPAAAGPSVAWTRQFGSSDWDQANAIAVDANRNQYVVGHTLGTLPGQTTSGQSDAFIRKLRPNGSVAWTRQFGTSSFDSAWGVAVDTSGRIYVAGKTQGAFPGKTNAGNQDAFLRKFRPNGSTVWTRQFGTDSSEDTRAVAVDKSGRIYVVGDTTGAFPGHTNKGSWDGFIRKFRPDGKTTWTRQFGTDSNDHPRGVAVDKLGRIYVAGQTGGTFPGQTNKGISDAFLRRFRPDGKTAWTRQFGSSSSELGTGVAVDKSGRIYVSGSTEGAIPGQTSKGLSDAYLRKFRPDGKTAWTRQFGTDAGDSANGVAVDKLGRVYVVGDTLGTFPGQTNKGSNDAYLRKYRPDGAASWTRQFGTNEVDVPKDVAIDKSSRIATAAQTWGAFPGKTNKGQFDVFVRTYRQ